MPSLPRTQTSDVSVGALFLRGFLKCPEHFSEVQGPEVPGREPGFRAEGMESRPRTVWQDSHRSKAQVLSA